MADIYDILFKASWGEPWSLSIEGVIRANGDVEVTREDEYVRMQKLRVKGPVEFEVTGVMHEAPPEYIEPPAFASAFVEKNGLEDAFMDWGEYECKLRRRSDGKSIRFRFTLVFISPEESAAPVIAPELSRFYFESEDGEGEEEEGGGEARFAVPLVSRATHRRMEDFLLGAGVELERSRPLYLYRIKRSKHSEKRPGDRDARFFGFE